MQAKHPWTLYWAAASQAQLTPRESRLTYEKAFELFRGAGDRVGAVLAASGAMFAVLYELDDCSLLDRWIAVLDEAEKSGVPLPSRREVEARVACSMFISLTLRQPQRRDMKQWIERALAAAHGQPDINLRMFVGLLAALTVMWTGLYSRAAQLIESLRAMSAAPGVTPFSLITLKNIEAMYAMFVADHAACSRAMREGLEIVQATGVHTWTFQLLVWGYGGALGSGDLAAAASIAKQLEPLTGQAGRFNVSIYRHFQAWEALLRKDLMEALQKEKAALRMAVEVGCPLYEVLCRLGLAGILADCGDERRCVSHLRTLRHIARGIDNRHLEFTCLTGFAQIALAHGRERTGMAALRRALELGREYGYFHFLGWQPAAVARVLAPALQAGIEPDYVKSLIKRRALVPEQAQPGVDSWPWTYRVQTFGSFRLLRHDEPLGTGGAKAKRRPLELLKLLIAYGGEQVSESRVTDALWPRIDGDSAHRSFTSTLHRLRKLLGEDRAVTLHEGRVSLDRRYFWLDTWAFEQLAADLESATEPPQIEKLVERVLALYRGSFMADEADAAWLIQTRERLRSRFLRVLSRVRQPMAGARRAKRGRACLRKMPGDRCRLRPSRPNFKPIGKRSVTDPAALARHAAAPGQGSWTQPKERLMQTQETASRRRRCRLSCSPAATSCRSVRTATTPSIFRATRRRFRGSRARASRRAGGAAPRAARAALSRERHRHADRHGGRHGHQHDDRQGALPASVRRRAADRRSDARVRRRAQRHRQRLRPERLVHELRIPDAYADAGRGNL